MKRVLIAAAAAGAALVTGILPASATTGGGVVYDSTPPAGTPNIVSQAYQATQMSEFGDAVNLAGTARTLNAVTVTMSSWACQQGAWNTGDCYSAPGAKFQVPITLNIYGAPVAGPNGTVVPGDLITRATKTFAIPYRPKANLQHCRDAQLGEWYSSSAASCFNGKAANISWNFTSLGLTLPDTVVIGVSFNTSGYGPHPLGYSNPCNSDPAGCPYDSLNLGLNDSTAIGTEQTPGAVFQNTATAGNLCDSTPATNEFNQDSPTDPCWTGYVPAFKITAH